MENYIGKECVLKSSTIPVKPVKSIIYAVEKRWLPEPTFGTPSGPRIQHHRNPQEAFSGSVENPQF
jgi:hypothetical protein